MLGKNSRISKTERVEKESKNKIGIQNIRKRIPEK